MAERPEIGKRRRGRNNKEDDKCLVQGLFSEKLKGLRFVRTTKPNLAGSPRTVFLTPPRTSGRRGAGGSDQPGPLRT